MTSGCWVDSSNETFAYLSNAILRKRTQMAAIRPRSYFSVFSDRRAPATWYVCLCCWRLPATCGNASESYPRPRPAYWRWAWERCSSGATKSEDAQTFGTDGIFARNGYSVGLPGSSSRSARNASRSAAWTTRFGNDCRNSAKSSTKMICLGRSVNWLRS